MYGRGLWGLRLKSQSLGNHAEIGVREAFVGIDVACAKGKLLPVVACVREAGRLKALPLRRRDILPPRGMGNRLALDSAVRAQFADNAAAYVATIERTFGLRVSCIALDAPRAPAHGSRRAAEFEMDRAGISCITTPTAEEFAVLCERARAHVDAGGGEANLPGANQIWMLVGFDLFRRLSPHYECIEVFPQAIARALGAAALHKSNLEGFKRQVGAVADAALWDPQELGGAAFGSRHDRLDAVMSAWVASLPSQERVSHGDGRLDTIWSIRPRAPMVAQHALELSNADLSVAPALRARSLKRSQLNAVRLAAKRIKEPDRTNER